MSCLRFVPAPVFAILLTQRAQHHGCCAENTMGLVVGDLNDDGFPDAFVGTGTPAWSEHDLLWLNSGEYGREQDGNTMAQVVEQWRGFEKHVIGQNTESKYAKTPKTHGHGAAFADFDRNWHTDLLLNPGGFALTDTLLAEMWKKDKDKKYRCAVLPRDYTHLGSLT